MEDKTIGGEETVQQGGEEVIQLGDEETIQQRVEETIQPASSDRATFSLSSFDTASTESSSGNQASSESTGGNQSQIVPAVSVDFLLFTLNSNEFFIQNSTESTNGNQAQVVPAYGHILRALDYSVAFALGCALFPFVVFRNLAIFTLGIGYDVGYAMVPNFLRANFTRNEYSHTLNDIYVNAKVFLNFISFLCLYLYILYMISISRRLFRWNSVSYKK